MKNIIIDLIKLRKDFKFISNLKFILLFSLFANTLFAEDRLWIDFGKEGAKYYESDDVNDDYLGNHGRGLFYSQKHGWGITTGLGYHELSIDDSFNRWFNNHDNKYYINNYNQSIYVGLGLEIKLFIFNLIGQRVLGVSQNKFSMEYSSLSDTPRTVYYSETTKNHYYTGSEILLLVRAEDNWLFGGKVGFYDRNILLRFGQTRASLRMPRTLSIILGKKWGTSSKKSSGPVPSGKRNTNNPCLLFGAC